LAVNEFAPNFQAHTAHPSSRIKADALLNQENIGSMKRLALSESAAATESVPLGGERARQVLQTIDGVIRYLIDFRVDDNAGNAAVLALARMLNRDIVITAPELPKPLPIHPGAQGEPALAPLALHRVEESGGHYLFYDAQGGLNDVKRDGLCLFRAVLGAMGGDHNDDQAVLRLFYHTYQYVWETLPSWNFEGYGMTGQRELSLAVTVALDAHAEAYGHAADASGQAIPVRHPENEREPISELMAVNQPAVADSRLLEETSKRRRVDSESEASSSGAPASKIQATQQSRVAQTSASLSAYAQQRTAFQADYYLSLIRSIGSAVATAATSRSKALEQLSKKREGVYQLAGELAHSLSRLSLMARPELHQIWSTKVNHLYLQSLQALAASVERGKDHERIAEGVIDILCASGQGVMAFFRGRQEGYHEALVRAGEASLVTQLLGLLEILSAKVDFGHPRLAMIRHEVLDHYPGLSAPAQNTRGAAERFAQVLREISASRLQLGADALAHGQAEQQQWRALQERNRRSIAAEGIPALYRQAQAAPRDSWVNAQLQANAQGNREQERLRQQRNAQAREDHAFREANRADIRRFGPADFMAAPAMGVFGAMAGLSRTNAGPHKVTPVASAASSSSATSATSSSSDSSAIESGLRRPLPSRSGSVWSMATLADDNMNLLGDPFGSRETLTSRRDIEALNLVPTDQLRRRLSGNTLEDLSDEDV
jgi:hypothetical protein